MRDGAVKENPRHTPWNHAPATAPSGKCSLRLRCYRCEAGGCGRKRDHTSRDAKRWADPKEPTLRRVPRPRFLSCRTGPLSPRVSRVSVQPPA